MSMLPKFPRGVKQPGRALRVARVIAARFLNYWRDQRAEGIDPREVTENKAREAFRWWKGATRGTLQGWPRADLRLACTVAAAYIAKVPQGTAAPVSYTVALERALRGH